MNPNLYIFSGAPPSWRVLLAFAFKNIQPNIHFLDYEKGDHRKPELALINPRGTIPFLTHRDTSVRDSIAIIAWLDRRYPDRPLFGVTPEDAAQIWQVSMEGAEYLRTANRVLLSTVFALRGRNAPQNSSETETLTKGTKLLLAECEVLEALLSDERAYLCGISPTAADAIFFPEIRLVQRAIDAQHDLMTSLGLASLFNTFPKVANWMTRLNAMPEVAATLPRHWNEKPEAA